MKKRLPHRSLEWRLVIEIETSVDYCWSGWLGPFEKLLAEKSRIVGERELNPIRNLMQ